MKKETMRWFGLLAFSLILSLSLISAYGYYLPSIRYSSENVVYAFVDFFEPILQILLGSYWTGGQFVFEILLIFILLVTVIYLAVGRVALFENSKASRWIVSIVIPLIGVRYIQYEWIQTILFQYQVIAIALTVVLPFIIYFYFLFSIAEDHGVIRKVGWGLYALVYFGIWSSQGPLSEANSGFYFWSFAVAIGMILFDNMIYRRYAYLQAKKSGSLNKAREVGKINTEIQEIQSMIRSGAIDPKEGQKFIKRLIQDRDFVQKHL